MPGLVKQVDNQMVTVNSVLNWSNTGCKGTINNYHRIWARGSALERPKMYMMTQWISEKQWKIDKICK